MRKDEARETGRQIGTELDDLTVLVRDVHKATARRLFGMLGDVGAPARLLHDGIAAVAYTSTRLGVRVVPSVLGAAASTRIDPAADSAHDVRKTRWVLGAVNGFRGDTLAITRRTLAPRMRMRTHDGPFRRVPQNVAHDTGGAATNRIVVFLHGLCENDLSWWLGAERNWGDPSITFGSKLREDDGWTPLYVFYNSGLHISANGRELADQLEKLVEAWPVRIEEIALVGHSMGGLVVRSAAHQADESRQRWVRSLKHVVGLGAPHLGAPLEQFVSRSTYRMSQLPETKPFADWLNKRSVGIKDLRFGAVLEADWTGFDPDTCIDDRCTEATLLPGVMYSMASATLSKNPEGRFAHDLLVAHGSAYGAGPTRSIAFDSDRMFHLGGKNHFALLNDPLVYEQLRTWLATPAVSPAASA